MDVDVIIVTYQSEGSAQRAVRSARACPAVGRIIVVDNASGDRSATVADEAGADLVLINPVNMGFAAAVNRGLRCTDADRILLLNPDATIGSECLALLSAALDREPKAALAAPLLVDQTGRVLVAAAKFSTLTNRIAMCLPMIGRLPWLRPHDGNATHAARSGRTTRVDSIWGAVVLADGRFLRAADGFDERFFLFSEDEDLCITAKAQERTVLLVGSARAFHVGGASSSDPGLREARRLFAAEQLFEKWYGQTTAERYRRGILATFRIRELALTVAASAFPNYGDRATEVRRARASFDRMATSGSVE